jgi:hypothetical protein
MRSQSFPLPQKVVALLLTRTRIQERKSSYLLDHYKNLHVALIGVAVGVAGIAAANILTFQGEHADRPLRILLLAASMLITANVYLGMMVGGIVLSAAVPTTLDLILPLLIGVSEFVLFGFVALNPGSPDAALGSTKGWLIAFMAVAALALCAILWVKAHLGDDQYAEDARPMIREYRRRMAADQAGAAAVCTIAAVVLVREYVQFWPWLHYVWPAVVNFVLLFGVWQHDVTVKSIARHLRD